MSKTIISDRILKAIARNCDNDEVVFDFLKNLLVEEADHPGQWWWKEIYRKNIEKYSKKGQKENETK